jgi:hypothetical protein
VISGVNTFLGKDNLRKDYVSGRGFGLELAATGCLRLDKKT